MSSWQDIPRLVRHSAVAIYNKSTGGGPDGVIQAIRISRDTLAKAGYLYHGKGLALLEGIQLTSKGWLRNRKHESEGKDGEAKDWQFAQMWKQIESQVWKLDGPSGKKPEPPKSPKEAAEMEKIGPKPGENTNKKVDDRKPSLYPPRGK